MRNRFNRFKITAEKNEQARLWGTTEDAFDGYMMARALEFSATIGKKLSSMPESTINTFAAEYGFRIEIHDKLLPTATTTKNHRMLTRMAACQQFDRVVQNSKSASVNDIRMTPRLFSSLEAEPLPSDWAYGDLDPITKKRKVKVDPKIVKDLFRLIRHKGKVIFELRTAEEFYYWYNETPEFELSWNNGLQWYFDVLIYCRNKTGEKAYWSVLCLRCPIMWSSDRGETHFLVHQCHAHSTPQYHALRNQLCWPGFSPFYDAIDSHEDTSIFADTNRNHQNAVEELKLHCGQDLELAQRDQLPGGRVQCSDDDWLLISKNIAGSLVGFGQTVLNMTVGQAEHFTEADHKMFCERRLMFKTGKGECGDLVMYGSLPAHAHDPEVQDPLTRAIHTWQMFKHLPGNPPNFCMKPVFGIFEPKTSRLNYLFE